MTNLRNEYLCVIEELVKSLWTKGHAKYQLVLDLNNGTISLKNCRKKKSHLIIGEFVINEQKPTVRNINAKASEIYHIIKDYDKDVLMCKSRAIKMYGKKFIEAIKPIKEVDNPHYKCASPMQLYDKNVLHHLIISTHC